MSDDELIEAARQARDHAHAPYSHFRVGAALLAHDGRLFTGCNVENAAYGLCNCAERTAFFTAIATGMRPGGFSRIAVIGDTPQPITPCGACRQVMFELGGPQLAVLLANVQGARRLTSMAELLPDGFGFQPSA
ncbi:cytidine deaminase [Eleftheria terrae]|uniref:cytidine deaminase n=1 Tax=Eleftheria terrae TaxID=1597781 RepID=UPI00263ADDD0|nr:cytidine deaminase [Eleftheria terrae]WKB55046.1 cytidine deaminase [Eleftheria terrae]